MTQEHVLIGSSNVYLGLDWGHSQCPQEPFRAVTLQYSLAPKGKCASYDRVP